MNAAQFLYPTSRQFPFDAACEQIVRALEARNWAVPGIEVEFRTYGSGDQKYRMVSRVRSTEFSLYFGRPQRRLGRWNDTAAVTELQIPKTILRVYNDESGPTLYTYVGTNYEDEREAFRTSLKVNAKLRGEPRMYLEYSGNRTYSGRRPTQLAHTNDLGRQYDPEGEPVSYNTGAVMAEFQAYLCDIVLPMIVEHDVATEPVDLFTEVPIPFPSTIGPLYCYANNSDLNRIQGDGDDPADRYGKAPGLRLLPLGVRDGNGPIPEIAYEGFVWCGVGVIDPNTPAESVEVPGTWPRYADRGLLRVTPNRANHVYIADHAAYEERRAEIWKQIDPTWRSSLTDAEVNEMSCARARTIVPIHEYTGGFTKPVVLIARELSLDEVRVTHS